MYQWQFVSGTSTAHWEIVLLWHLHPHHSREQELQNGGDHGFVKKFRDLKHSPVLAVSLSCINRFRAEGTTAQAGFCSFVKQPSSVSSVMIVCLALSRQQALCCDRRRLEQQQG